MPRSHRAPTRIQTTIRLTEAQALTCQGARGLCHTVRHPGTGAGFFNVGKFYTQVGQYKKLRIFRIAGDVGEAFICKVYLVVFFIYIKKQAFIHFGHFLRLIGQVIVFAFLKLHFYARLTQKFNQRTIFRQTTV